MRRVLVAVSLVVQCLLLPVSCADHNPVGPTSSATLDRFVQALGQQGLSVSLGVQISPSANGFFSVPAQQLRVNDTQMSAFVYASPQDAATEAAAISADGQPSPTARVTWVSTPRFYRQGALIALYVGCSAETSPLWQAVVRADIPVWHGRVRNWCSRGPKTRTVKPRFALLSRHWDPRRADIALVVQPRALSLQR